MRAYGSISPIEGEWQQLAEATGAPPFLAPGWIDAWLRSFGGDGLRIYTAWRSDQLVGVLPLRRTPDGTALSPANWHTPIFAPLALDDTAAATLARAVHADRPRRIEVRCFDADLPASRAFTDELDHLGYLQAPERHVRLSPFADLAPDWETFSRRLGRRRRASLRRNESRLSELGELRTELITDGTDLEEKLQEGFEVESSGWKGAEGTAINSSAEIRGFYRRMARWAADSGSLRLLFIRLDERPIAFSICLERAGVIHGLRMGFDEEFRSHGPGVLMLKDVMLFGIERGATRVEMGGNLETDAFKSEWSDGAHRLVTATWRSPTARGRAEHLAEDATRRTKAWLAATLPPAAIARAQAARSAVVDRVRRS